MRYVRRVLADAVTWKKSPWNDVEAAFRRYYTVFTPGFWQREYAETDVGPLDASTLRELKLPDGGHTLEGETAAPVVVTWWDRKPTVIAGAETLAAARQMGLDPKAVVIRIRDKRQDK